MWHTKLFFRSNINMTPQLQPLGAIPDPPEITAMLEKRVPPIAHIAPQDLPTSVDLSSGLPPIRHQVGSSCVGWAIGYNHKTYDEYQEFGWNLNTYDHQFSANYIYNQINGGANVGTSPYAAYQLLCNQGQFTNNGMAGCCSITNFPTTDYGLFPTADHGKRAAPYVASTFGKYNNTNLHEIREILASGNVVTFLVPWARNCDSPSAYYIIYDPSTGFRGYHQICICGYDLDISGTGVSGFRFANSHGTSYGDNGFAWLSEEFIYTSTLSGMHFSSYWMIDLPTPPYNVRVENNALIWDGSPTITYNIYNSSMSIIASVTGNSYTPTSNGTYYIGAYGSEPIETIEYIKCSIPSCNFGVI